MIQVDMRQKNVQVVGLNKIPNTKHPGAGIQNHAKLWQHQTGRLTTIIWVVTGGAEKV